LSRDSAGIAEKFPTVLINTICSVLPMRVIKSVSVPVELVKKIEKIPNFSAYVCSVLNNDDLDAAMQRIEALRTQIRHYEQVLRDLSNSDQRVTRKEYIRNVVNTIDEKCPYIWRETQ
jgi:hypothetical protein